MAWNNNNYTFGNPSKRMVKAFKTVIEEAKNEHSILNDVYVSIKKLPVDADVAIKQVILQPIDNTDMDNGFTRWQTYGVSVYATTIEEVEDLAEAIEGCITLIRGIEGIRFAKVILSASETENSFSVLSRNQSTLEEWRLLTFEANLSPVTFIKPVIVIPVIIDDPAIVSQINIDVTMTYDNLSNMIISGGYYSGYPLNNLITSNLGNIVTVNYNYDNTIIVINGSNPNVSYVKTLELIINTIIPTDNMTLDSDVEATKNNILNAWVIDSTFNPSQVDLTSYLVISEGNSVQIYPQSANSVIIQGQRSSTGGFVSVTVSNPSLNIEEINASVESDVLANYNFINNYIASNPDAIITNGLLNSLSINFTKTGNNTISIYRNAVDYMYVSGYSADTNYSYNLTISNILPNDFIINNINDLQVSVEATQTLINDYISNNPDWVGSDIFSYVFPVQGDVQFDNYISIQNDWSNTDLPPYAFGESRNINYYYSWSNTSNSYIASGYQV